MTTMTPAEFIAHVRTIEVRTATFTPGFPLVTMTVYDGHRFIEEFWIPTCDNVSELVSNEALWDGDQILLTPLGGGVVHVARFV